MRGDRCDARRPLRCGLRVSRRASQRLFLLRRMVRHSAEHEKTQRIAAASAHRSGLRASEAVEKTRTRESRLRAAMRAETGRRRHQPTKTAAAAGHRASIDAPRHPRRIAHTHTHTHAHARAHTHTHTARAHTHAHSSARKSPRTASRCDGVWPPPPQVVAATDDNGGGGRSPRVDRRAGRRYACRSAHRLLAAPSAGLRRSTEAGDTSRRPATAT